MDQAIVTRHGESTSGARGAVNGDPGVKVPLTDHGRAQARDLHHALAVIPIDLCLTSTFERTQETAAIALVGRDIPCLALPTLDDMAFGAFEGRPLEAYRAWARIHPLDESTPGGGESRTNVVRRYCQAFRSQLERSERHVLVVAHGLPLTYLLRAARGERPGPGMQPIEAATPYHLSRRQLQSALDLLEAAVEMKVVP